MRRVTKIVFVASDGTEHATEVDCEHWERYSTIRNLLEDADFDWRDGSGPDAATTDTVAKYLADHLVLTMSPGAAS